MIIRDERPGDEAAIAELTTAAFLDAPHSDGTEAQVIDRLRAAGALSLSMVGVIDEVIVGHVAFSPVTLSGGEPRWFGLGPVSVSPSRQGGGIGSALIRQGLERLRESGAAGCVVLGDPAYYSRFGFRADHRLVLADVPPEYFQVLPLHGPDAFGMVAYHKGFYGDAC